MTNTKDYKPKVYIQKITKIRCVAIDQKNDETLLKFKDGRSAWFLNRWIVRDFEEIKESK